MIKADTPVINQDYLDAVQSMARMHRHHPAHAIFTVGDNVYPNGIGTDHSKLETIHNDVFKRYGEGLEHLPFFPVLGNHDHCDDPEQ